MPSNAQAALLAFYAIFWGTAIHSSTRYRLFDTSSMFWGDKRAGYRGTAGILFINVAPAAWFCMLWAMVGNLPDEIWAIFLSALGSISVFGWPRILHAFIASTTFQSIFYEPQEHAEMMAKYPASYWLKGAGNQFWAHAFPGLLWLTFFVLPILYLSPKYS